MKSFMHSPIRHGGVGKGWLTTMNGSNVVGFQCRRASDMQQGKILVSHWKVMFIVEDSRLCFPSQLGGLYMLICVRFISNLLLIWTRQFSTLTHQNFTRLIFGSIMGKLALPQLNLYILCCGWAGPSNIGAARITLSLKITGQSICRSERVSVFTYGYSVTNLLYILHHLHRRPPLL